jgi:very-short-patch-repair endonuclease
MNSFFFKNPDVIANARMLRQRQTKYEKMLWTELRNRKLADLKFLRQHPIIFRVDEKLKKYFIADFYCSVKKTVIELDGPIHDDQPEYDEFRDEVLRSMNLNILRIKNEELSDIKAVKEKILLFVSGIG